MYTLDSIEKQSYSHLEIIVVDDSSTDASLKLIEQFRVRMMNSLGIAIKVIVHEQNMGVTNARNTGLDNATGEFIYHIDADDWIEPDAIELMVNEAVGTEADIVGFNWWLTFSQNEREMKQPQFSDPWQALERMMIGTMKWNVWMFLVRHELYINNKIRFIPNMNMGEDMIMTMKLFSCSNKVVYLDRTLYHYNQSNINSMTKTYSEKHIKEVTFNVEELERFLLNSNFGAKSKPLINCLKLNIKLPLLISNKNSQYDRWRSWFSEANGEVTSNKNVSLRIRLLQWAAVHKKDWIIKLHYYLVIRLVYGVIYK